MTAITQGIHLVPIDEIVVPEGRQREGLGGGKEAQTKLKELATSIQKYGVLNPIILRPDKALVAGFRRLNASRLAGLAEVPVRYSDELDAVALEEIELDENVQRQNLTWQEQASAIARIHELRKAQDPNWGQAETAEVTGVQRDRVSRYIQLTEMTKLFPQISKAKNMFQALSQMTALAKGVNRTQAVKDNPIDYGDLEAKIWLGDSVELIKSIPAESFHHIVTDPPFGINFDSRISDGTDSVTQYSDSAGEYRRILGMAPDLYRVLKPDGFLIWFLGITWYEEAKVAFREAGFTVDEIPIIWDRTEGSTFSRRSDRYFTRGYDIALHCLKGDAELTKRGRNNIFRFKPVAAEDAEQSVERPVELYAELINYLSVRGEIIADFFSGSGSVAAASVSTGRDFFAIEKDPVRRSRAMAKVQSFVTSA